MLIRNYSLKDVEVCIDKVLQIKEQFRSLKLLDSPEMFFKFLSRKFIRPHLDIQDIQFFLVIIRSAKCNVFKWINFGKTGLKHVLWSQWMAKVSTINIFRNFLPVSWIALKWGSCSPKRFNENPLIMKNAFYFTLKALFVCRIFKFLSRRFW